MKKKTTVRTLCAAGYVISVLLLISCQTTEKSAHTESKSAAPAAEKKQTPATAPAKAADSVKKGPSESALFISKMKEITLTVVSSPKSTVKHKPFSEPFTVTVTGAGEQPAAGFPVTVSWPSSRTGDSIVYASKNFVTDEDGSFSFMPDAPQFSFDDKATFYPTPVNSDAAVQQAAYDAGVSAPWRVRTDYVGKTGLLYVFDCDKNGKVVTNSMNMLKALRNSGINIGNSPISSSSYLSKPVSVLYHDTKAIVGTSFAVMISGSVKYSSPVTSTDGLSTVSLIGDIVCIDMKDGTELYTTSQTASASAKAEYKALEECRAKLAEKITHAILYGM